MFTQHWVRSNPFAWTRVETFHAIKWQFQSWITERGSHHQQKPMDYGHKPEPCCHRARRGSLTPATPPLAIIYAKLFNKPLCHLITFDVTVGRLTCRSTWATGADRAKQQLKNRRHPCASEAKHKQIIEPLEWKECLLLAEIRTWNNVFTLIKKTLRNHK